VAAQGVLVVGPWLNCEEFGPWLGDDVKERLHGNDGVIVLRRVCMGAAPRPISW